MTFRIYEIKSYSNWTNKRIENKFEEYELNDLISILQNQNKGYHQRIDPIKQYQFLVIVINFEVYLVILQKY